MNIIAILEDASWKNLPTLERHCRRHNWTLKEVTMDYNPSKGLPKYESTEHWPFKAVFDEDGELYEVRIYALTAGYNGTGPHDLTSILDYLGVSYDPEDIYTKRKVDSEGWIHLSYTL